MKYQWIGGGTWVAATGVELITGVRLICGEVTVIVSASFVLALCISIMAGAVLLVPWLPRAIIGKTPWTLAAVLPAGVGSLVAFVVAALSAPSSSVLAAAAALLWVLATMLLLVGAVVFMTPRVPNAGS